MLKIFKMQFKCSFCSRTFSTRSACTQHINHCSPLDYPSSSSSEESSDLITTNINDMSLGSEDFSNVDEVKNK
jgi:hypothetical protein